MHEVFYKQTHIYVTKNTLHVRFKLRLIKRLVVQGLKYQLCFYLEPFYKILTVERITLKIQFHFKNDVLVYNMKFFSSYERVRNAAD